MLYCVRDSPSVGPGSGPGVRIDPLYATRNRHGDCGATEFPGHVAKNVPGTGAQCVLATEKKSAAHLSQASCIIMNGFLLLSATWYFDY